MSDSLCECGFPVRECEGCHDKPGRFASLWGYVPMAWMVALRAAQNGEIRLALGILTWPRGWSHTREEK